MCIRSITLAKMLDFVLYGCDISRKMVPLFG